MTSPVTAMASPYLQPLPLNQVNLLRDGLPCVVYHAPNNAQFY
jgi:hypothetical protein